MKLRLSIILLAAALAAAPAAGQTIKSLGYNTTNGNIVAATNVTFTNSVGFATNARAATRTNLGATTVGNAVFTATNAAAAATAIGLGTTNAGTFQSLTAELLQVRLGTNLYVGLADDVSEFWTDVAVNETLFVSGSATFATNVTVNGNLSVGSLTTTTPSTWALDATQTAAATNGILALPSNANVIRLTNNNAISGVSGGVLGAFYYLVNQTTNAVTISNDGGITVQGGTSLTLGANQAATLVATGATNASVAARGDLNDVTLGGTQNLAPSQTADSGDHLMTRDLGDARYSPMPMTPQIVPWFYNGTHNVTRVTNGSASFGTSPAYPILNTTTNSSDAAVMVFVADVWGAVDSAANPFNSVGRTVILQGRLTTLATNVVARFVWSSSTNWPTVMTNLGTNGISNLGWAIETRNNGSNEARLIVHGATSKSESAWTALVQNVGNDASFMVVPKVGSTSLYVASSGEPFSKTPLITVSNQIGGSVSGAFQGGLGVAVVNTNTASGNSTVYIRRAYQALGMTNYGY